MPTNYLIENPILKLNENDAEIAKEHIFTKSEERDSIDIIRNMEDQYHKKRDKKDPQRYELLTDRMVIII